MNFSDALMKVAAVAANNKYLASIRDAFTDYMPFTIIGAIGTLWTYVIVDGTSGLGALIPAVQGLSFLNPLFNALNFATMGCITLGVTFAIGYQVGKRNGQNAFYCALIALASLLIVTNSTVDLSVATVALADGTSVSLADILPAGAAANVIGAIANGNLGATGMFTGMIVGIISVEILNVLEKVDTFKIKLPDAVPHNIAGSFNALIPSTFTLLIVGGIAFVLQQLTGFFLNDLIFNVILAPLASYVISYLLTAIGFCPVMYINVPWTTPIILSGFLASGGNIMGAVTQVICLAVAVLIYIPCIKAYEATKNAEDAKLAE